MCLSGEHRSQNLLRGGKLSIPTFDILQSAKREKKQVDIKHRKHFHEKTCFLLVSNW